MGNLEASNHTQHTTHHTHTVTHMTTMSTEEGWIKSFVIEFLILWPVATLAGLIGGYFAECFRQKRTDEEYAQMRQEFKETVVCEAIIVFTRGCYKTFVDGHTPYCAWCDEDTSAWFILWSVLAVFVWMETSLYWLHRHLHARAGAWIGHKQHHARTHPTAFSVSATSPVEAVVLTLNCYALRFLLPVNGLVLECFLLAEGLRQFVGHMSVTRGCDPHHEHHIHPTTNYSQHYTQFWDWVMGTMHIEAAAKDSDAGQGAAEAADAGQGAASVVG